MKRPTLTLVALVFVLLAACQARRAAEKPTIEFTRVPKADDGGTANLGMIEGRVRGAQAGDRIVLYARSGVGVWWVQPFADQPFTTIQRDMTWRSSTHLGTEYAALLVKSNFKPLPTTTELPQGDPDVVLAQIAHGERTARRVSRTLHFSGYEWEIRHVPSDRGGTLNTYDPANAWTDERGFLHLRIARDTGGWTCAEVIMTRSLGYGSYRFVVQDTSQLEPAAVLGMFTWDDLAPDDNYREIDIEVSRWGDQLGKSAQYVVQPYYVPANVVRFTAPSGPATHSFRWQPGRVLFRSVRAGGDVVAEHELTSGVPLPGGESIRMNLYVFGNKKNPMQNPAEVVIEKFEFLP